MNKFLIWGTGAIATQQLEFYNQINVVAENKIIGFVDNAQEKWGGEFGGYSIYASNEIENLSFDYICIWVKNGEEVRRQIVGDLKIPEDQIGDIFLPYKQLIFEKYKNINDSEMQKFMVRLRNNSILSVYYYDKADDRKILHEIHYDREADLHFVYFESKRMYLKRSYQSFVNKSGKLYTGSFWGEQDLNSPHLYEYGDISVKEGDVIVDAGVCEGNFSLHHIDKASKIYLIECDTEWMEALRYTFLPYKDKVVFCNKFLSDTNSENTINLNTLVTEPVNFIKMDIEGAETPALIGADKVFKNSNDIRCAICSYHRHEDEKKISALLNGYGLETETSKGYMLFLFDSYVLDNPELRRGIVRGRVRGIIDG